MKPIYPIANDKPLRIRSSRHTDPRHRVVVIADPIEDEGDGIVENLILLHVPDARRLAERLLKEARRIEEAIASE